MQATYMRLLLLLSALEIYQGVQQWTKLYLVNYIIYTLSNQCNKLFKLHNAD